MDNEQFAMYENRALQYDSEAQYVMYNCYRNGVNVPRDEVKAINWLKLSVKQGNESAVNELNRLREFAQQGDVDYQRILAIYDNTAVPVPQVDTSRDFDRYRSSGSSNNVSSLTAGSIFAAVLGALIVFWLVYDYFETERRNAAITEMNKQLEEQRKEINRQLFWGW